MVWGGVSWGGKLFGAGLGVVGPAGKVKGPAILPICTPAVLKLLQRQVGSAGNLQSVVRVDSQVIDCRTGAQVDGRVLDIPVVDLDCVGVTAIAVVRHKTARTAPVACSVVVPPCAT